MRLGADYLLNRVSLVVVGGIAGLVVGELTLGWWWDLGLPMSCQDLFYPDPLECDVLFFIRDRVDLLFVPVGALAGWLSSRPPVHERTSRLVLKVVGELVATAALFLGVVILVSVGLEFSRLRLIPWREILPSLIVVMALFGGGLLYLLGLFRYWSGRELPMRLLGWVMFSTVLLLPLLTASYLTRWWVLGGLLSALALPAVLEWGRRAPEEGDGAPPVDLDRSASRDR